MTKESKTAAPAGGSQTLMRGLDVIEAVTRSGLSLGELADAVGLSRSTTHRLAASLIERNYLAYTPRQGYRLGPKLLQLGHAAHSQADLLQIVRPQIEALSDSTGDTVHFGVLDGDQALYLDKMPGQRRITISSRVGDRQPLTSTGLGKALMLDSADDYWQERLIAEAQTAAGTEPWLARMRRYAAVGYAFDLEENEDQIRCVAAPVRGATGAIVGAISVSSAAQYMDDARMAALSTEVVVAARAISRELGWQGPEGELRDAAE